MNENMLQCIKTLYQMVHADVTGDNMDRAIELVTEYLDFTAVLEKAFAFQDEANNWRVEVEVKTFACKVLGLLLGANRTSRIFAALKHNDVVKQMEYTMFCGNERTFYYDEMRDNEIADVDEAKFQLELFK